MQLKWPMRWDLFSLFPAYAGVILRRLDAVQPLVTFPRIRGGDPFWVSVCWAVCAFSPHTRG